MESPVVVDKPPEYHAKGTQDDNDKGFPFEEARGGDGDRWSELAARHPDIAARLRAHPAAAGWARKRRNDHNQPDNADDFGSGLGEHFNRFPFDDIPPEFREHLPSHWGHRYTPQERTAPTEEHNYHQQQPTQFSPPSQPTKNTISTQTEEDLLNPKEREQRQEESIPQHGLRNTVDLGQKTPADPSLLDADERNQRAMSAPPGNRAQAGNAADDHNTQATNVRHIPIFVEGRDSPIINRRNVEPTVNVEPQQYYAPSPPEREQYFDRDPGMGFHHRAQEPEFGRFFGGPFSKGFRQGHQPFAPQAAYQQAAASPGRAQSPKPQGQHYTQIPVHHANSKQNPQQQSQTQQHPQQKPQPPHQPQQEQQQPQQQQEQQQQHQPPPPSANDPIAKILSIQKDVLELMTEVENFTGKKSDKRYVYLDEMLTRNLIKLDDIETEGKENIRQARREAIKCIQKCIAVLEAKAEGRIPTTPQPNNNQPEFNGEISSDPTPAESTQENETKDQNMEEAGQPTEKINAENPVESVTSEEKKPNEEKKEDTKATPKNTKKVVKKRDKSKDKSKEEISDNVEMKDSPKPADVQPMETDASSQ